MPVRPPLIACLALAIICEAGLTHAAPPVTRQFTRNTSFVVKFSLASSASAKDPPREVELHASSDRGATWQVAGAAKPSEAGIPFRAPADGEYWFMPRTKYASGRYLPEGPPMPEMKVVVDSTPPVLELDARNDDGEVVILWRIADANLKRDSFHLEYKAAGANGSWQPVAVAPVEAPPQTNDLSGETTVVLPIREQSAAIVVRAQVADEAGNRTVKEQPLAAAGSSEIASVHRLDSLDGRRREDNAPPDMSATFPHEEPSPAEGPTAPYPTTSTPDWPAEEGATPFSDTERLPSTSGPPQRDGGAAANPAVRRLSDFPNAAPLSDVPPDYASADGLPLGVRPHLVNKPRFELLYDVDAIGSGGVVQVELWTTSDGGRTWTSYGLDEDCRSPMLVQMEKEGLYGFRVVVETTAGLRSPSPANGDLPDVWVGVDFTKPAARLISASQGEGDEADRLVVCWQAADQHLAPRGISLRWAEGPQGPWATIASGLENTGRYAWRLDRRLPGTVYLLLEVRDEAGNVTTDQLSEAVSLDRIRPRGRIREVRPVSAAPLSGRRL